MAVSLPLGEAMLPVIEVWVTNARGRNKKEASFV
jgi:hypothetical protein